MANNIHTRPAIAPVAARTDNTAIVSTTLDTFGYDSATLALVTGTNTDANATFVVLLEEPNDSGMSGVVAVADIDLVGTEALARLASSSTTTLKSGSWVTWERKVHQGHGYAVRQRRGQHLSRGHLDSGPSGLCTDR